MILKIEIIEYQQYGHKQATFKACTADALAMNEKGKREFSSLMELTERIKKTVEAYYSEVNSTRDARNRVTGAGEQGKKDAMIASVSDIVDELVGIQVEL